MDEQYDKFNVMLLSVLAYFGPMFLIGKFAQEKSIPLVKFHCSQGMRLFIFEISSVVAVFLFKFLLVYFPVAQETLPVIFSLTLFIVCVILFIMGIFSAVKKQMTPLPFIGGKTTCKNEE